MANIDETVTTHSIVDGDMLENVKYPIAPASPFENDTPENAAVESSGVKLNKSAITALLVFSCES
jgi:hypothetical protein